MRTLRNKIVRYFVEGTLIIVPFALTGFLIFYALHKFHQAISFVVKYLPVLSKFSMIPGLNLFMVCLSICFVGYIASNFIIRALIEFLEQMVLKTPVVNIIYSYIKESTSAFVEKFDIPVLVTINKKLGIEKIGFITQHNLENLGIENKVAVYIPHSYSFSGELNIIPREDVRRLNVPRAQVLQFILSGGLAEIKRPLSIKENKNM